MKIVNFCHFFQKSSFFMKIVNFCHFSKNRPKIVKNPGGVKKKHLDFQKVQKTPRKPRLKNTFWPVDRGPTRVRNPKKVKNTRKHDTLAFFGHFSKTVQKSSFFGGSKKTRFLMIFWQFLTIFEFLELFGTFWTKKRVKNTRVSCFRVILSFWGGQKHQKTTKKQVFLDPLFEVFFESRRFR